MTEPLSVFLDLVRFAAACLVVAHHACFTKFGTGLPGVFAATGTEPVVVFFVLSGFVIAYTAKERERSWSSYACGRAARLLSVVVPALVLTAVCDAIGARLDPALYADHWTDAHTLANLATAPAWRYLVTLAFCNELWWTDLWPGTNSPFWSLGYEVGYYLLFGCAFYLRGRARMAALLLVALVLGPKILLLAPTFGLGVLVWNLLGSIRIGRPLGLGLAALGLLGYLAFIVTGARTASNLRFEALLGAHWIDRLGLSDLAASNFITACCFSLVLAGFTGIQPLAELLVRLRKPGRALGGVTFSMYLFHYPLIYFFAALGIRLKLGWFQPVIVLLGTGLSIVLLSRVTETRKRALKQMLQRLLDRWLGNPSSLVEARPPNG